MKKEERLKELENDFETKSSKEYRNQSGLDLIQNSKHIQDILDEISDLNCLADGTDLDTCFLDKKLRQERNKTYKDLINESDPQKQDKLRRRYIDLKLLMQGKRPVWNADLLDKWDSKQ